MIHPQHRHRHSHHHLNHRMLYPHRRPYHTLPYHLDTVFHPGCLSCGTLYDIVRLSRSFLVLSLLALHITPDAVDNTPLVDGRRRLLPHPARRCHRSSDSLSLCNMDLSMHLYILCSNAFSCRSPV